MRNPLPQVRATAAVLAVTALLAAGCGSTDSPKASSGPEQLVGLLKFTPGAVDGNAVRGTWFRMVQPGGTPENGPYMPNGDSPAQGGSTTLLEPGTAGGLRVGGYQSEPKPGFAQGNSLSASVTKPTKFFAVEFGVSTNPVDPQTQREVPPPTIIDNNGKLTADLSAWAASWNDQEFNQGAPKPPEKQGAQVAGSEQVQKVWDWVAHQWFNRPKPDAAQGPSATGTYDPKTHAITLQWTSLIVGGPFNGFTGVWHLEGTFVPDTSTPTATSAPTSSATGDGSPAAPTPPATPGSLTTPLIPATPASLFTLRSGAAATFLTTTPKLTAVPGSLPAPGSPAVPTFLAAPDFAATPVGSSTAAETASRSALSDQESLS